MLLSELANRYAPMIISTNRTIKRRRTLRVAPGVRANGVRRIVLSDSNRCGPVRSVAGVAVQRFSRGSRKSAPRPSNPPRQPRRRTAARYNSAANNTPAYAIERQDPPNRFGAQHARHRPFPADADPHKNRNTFHSHGLLAMPPIVAGCSHRRGSAAEPAGDRREACARTCRRPARACGRTCRRPIPAEPAPAADALPEPTGVAGYPLAAARVAMAGASTSPEIVQLPSRIPPCGEITSLRRDHLATGCQRTTFDA